jgi:hypothetical protein
MKVLVSKTACGIVMENNVGRMAVEGNVHRASLKERFVHLRGNVWSQNYVSLSARVKSVGTTGVVAAAVVAAMDCCAQLRINVATNVQNVGSARLV